ncbi:MAG TPA: DUF2877 domain-containing protein [Arachnia sp.]|nr:DUF2877 domain-containing protein [Arachnia sp.]
MSHLALSYTLRLGRSHRPEPFLVGATVEHVGARTVVLSRLGELVYLTDDSAGLMPGGHTLTPAGIARLRSELAPLGVGVQIDRGWSEPTTGRPTSLELPNVRLSPLRVRELGHLVDGSHLDAGLRDALASLVGDASPSEAIGSLIGTGPGTTPSGDDVLVGVLAGWQLTGQVHRLTTARALITALLPATTRASGHFLRWAMAGSYATPVLDLARALADEGSLAHAMTALRRFGATSGHDLAIGLATTLAGDSGHVQRSAA